MDPTERKITKIAREAGKFTVQAMKEEGIGTAEFDFIHLVRHHPGITQTEVREQLKIDKGAAARRAASLEAKGYLIRKPNPWDGRSQLLYATEKAETGNIENKYQIKINNFEINLSKRLSKFKIYDTIVLENKFKIFSDFYLPISLVKITNKEIKEEQKNYNVEQAKDLGIEQLQEELDNEIEDKSKVVNKIINTYEKEDGIEVYVTYEVLEDIGTNEKIVF